MKYSNVLKGDFAGHEFHGNQWTNAGVPEGALMSHEIAAAKDFAGMSSEKQGLTLAQAKADPKTSGPLIIRLEHIMRNSPKDYRNVNTNKKISPEQHAKELAADNWHTRTMAGRRDKTHEQLRFIARDATEAAALGEQMGSKGSGKYRDEAHYANMERKARERRAASGK